MKYKHQIRVIAESDARFDGYADGLVHMPRASQERYIARATKSFFALKAANHKSLTIKIKGNEDVEY